MAKRAERRWRDWRVDKTSGQSIRADDKGGLRKQREARTGWWWTTAAREAECGICGRQLLRQKIAYQYRTKRILCTDCARAEAISEMCRPSRKMLKVNS